MVDRRTLLGAGVGVAAAATLRPAFGFAQDAELSGDVTYWHHFTSDSEMQGWKRSRALTTATRGDGHLENIPNADFMTQFTTAAVGGSLPDTTMAASDRIPDMLALGGLVDLTERFNSWEGAAGLDPSVMTAGTIDGKIVGIPAFLFVDWMYYRTDWFDEAGLSVPNTWAEFRDAAIALTDASKDRYGFGLRGGDGGQGHVMSIMRAYGGLSADDAGLPVIDRDKAIEAIAFWAGLYTTDKLAPPSAPNDSYSQIMQAFRTGQTGMLLHHTGSLAEISADLEQGTQFMTMMVPEGPAMRVAGVSPLYNGMCKEDNGDAAWAWLTNGPPGCRVALQQATAISPPPMAASRGRAHHRQRDLRCRPGNTIPVVCRR